MAILIGLCGYIILVLRVFPHTPIGRLLTLKQDMQTSKASDDTSEHLLGQTGTAHTDLRPSGIALFGTRRVDVIAEGNLKVVTVTGNRVVVRQTESSAST